MRAVELDWTYFRRLHEGLLEHHDDVDARRRHLSGQRQAAAEHLDGLAEPRTREPIPAGGYTGDDEQLWRVMKLYALSRISDYLLELSCPAGEPPAGFGVTGARRLEPAAIGAHAEFFAALGMTPFEHADAFSPFHHEVFAVVQDPSATSATVEEVLWPGFRFGDLQFSRAGVRVRAPRHLIDAAVATTSTLYFTHRRDPRRTADLSHGWGSNSQWRTSFHRFYSDAEGLHLNWDGEVDLGNDHPADRAGDGAPLDQRRELLLHRCFVRADLPDDESDRFPYDDRLSLTTAEWPLRPESIKHVSRGP